MTLIPDEPLKDTRLTPVRESRVRMGIFIGLSVSIGVIQGGWVWIIMSLGITTLAFIELRALCLQKGVRLSKFVFYPSTIAMSVVAHVDKITWLWPVLIGAVGIGSFQWLFNQPRRTLADLSASIFSLLYLGILPVHTILLREEGVNEGLPLLQQDGLHYMLLVVFIIIAADVGAYYVGKTFGKRLLYEELSPKKTFEGAFCGLIVGTIVGMAGSYLIGFPLQDGYALSTLVIIAAALGDLVESKIKREIGVKDSSGLLKGHGGVLDRIDSYLFAVPLAYYYIHWVIHHEGIWLEVLSFTGKL
jgi:phosphatidate cytidylyltransferase